MGKFDYPPAELKREDKNAYMVQLYRAKQYDQRLAELQNLIQANKAQAKYHSAKAKEYLGIYNELLKENEQ